ncbi:uncharacterized protein EDB93DRAFT_1246176 [Suillus bovinus]|uniref:uncharacterized protein n=1 Tax=Suillus bovinus TaxID=48563 RepID=UPI001B88625D|nr:uncharacterized protein EDB93DRAFT_1246176 [Suillus bovinus]KAG2158325.1 hypothetical protein EDB93DRAFT_1246176 [Suillus bovinus]
MPNVSADMPPRPEFTPFTIPYLCISKPYDGKGFWTYPERHGWIIHAKDKKCHVLCPPGICRDGSLADSRTRVQSPILSRINGMPVTASDKVEFLQAWLFFGVLTEVSALCGLELDVEAEFIVDNGSVSTAKLNGLPGRWFAAAMKKNRAGDHAFMEHILSIVRHAILMLSEEKAEDHTRIFKYTYAECRVLHSLDITARIVALHLLLHVYMPGFTVTDENGWGRQRILKSVDWLYRECEGMDQLSDIVETELTEKGWCQSEIDLLASDDLAFASLLTRPRIRDHSSCGDVICNAYQTDEATYVTRHVQDGCSCKFVGVPASLLVNALSQNKVPKLCITGQLELRVVMEDNYPYIAFSHVWADGLGNPLTNALPRCQLRRLRDYANKLYRTHNPAPTSESADLPVALWLDTLCIPVERSAVAYRKKAIQLLGKTFNEADAVLVLDRELEIVESAAASFLELGLRILCSGWMKRLWTLQEATLASEAHNITLLYFQMHDGPFLYQKYDRNRRALQRVNERTTEVQAEERSLLLDDGMMLELGAQLPSVGMMRNMRQGWSPFSVIYSAIEHRSTSKAEDVPICIASLLGKDLSTIISGADVEQRMANFYVLMREVPLGVMWCEGPERLSIKPFRWAPLSISACPPTTFMGWEDCVCDSAGLHVKYGGFIFAESEEERHDSKAILPHVIDMVSAETGGVLGRLSDLPILERREITLQRNLAVIVRHDDHSGMHPAAAIVVVEDTVEVDGGMQLTEFVCRIVGYMYLWSSDRDPGTGVRVHATAVDQMWCIT